jgi:choline dehydrogenase-like flavoprotein
VTNYLDARTDAVEKNVSCGLCIIGAGAAGITLARKLARVYGDVVLMEAGSFELDYATQQLYLGQNLGLAYYDLQGCRLRYFGGTTNHWSGYCRANDPIDYEGRPELDVPAWPVRMEEIQPFVDEAARELGIRAEFFDPTFYTRELDFPESVLFESNNASLETKVFQIARDRRFGQLYRDELGTAPGLRVLLNLNAVHLQLSADGNRLDSVRARTLTGKDVTIRAKVFVVACHAIENARLLLASDDIHKTGLGNSHDQVGRHFMEHPWIWASKLIPTRRFSVFYDWQYGLRRDLNANLSLSAQTMKDLGILQYYCRFDPVFAEEGVRDAVSGVKAHVLGPFDRELLDDLVTVVGDFSDVVEYELNGRDIVNTLPNYYRIEHRIEQAPNANSRITLSDERDALGTRCADVNWSLRDVDYRTFREGHDFVVRELSALGAGRFIVDEPTRELIDANVSGKFHHMGTTRMGATAREGVVDVNARVHGVDNLYVMGSSIFPTSGYSGPTMMIVAFALRLVEHLKQSAPALAGPDLSF